MSMTEDLMEQIQKHLPQMVSKQLQERLALADKADEALDACERYAKETHQLRMAAAGEERERARLAALDRELAERARKIELQELELKLRIEHATEKSRFVQQALETVFKNREVTHTMIGSLPAGVAQPSQYSSYPQAMSAPVELRTKVEG